MLFIDLFIDRLTIWAFKSKCMFFCSSSKITLQKLSFSHDPLLTISPMQNSEKTKGCVFFLARRSECTVQYLLGLLGIPLVVLALVVSFVDLNSN